MQKQPREYNVKLNLASGANLEMLMFSDMEHKWIFHYRFSSPEEHKILEAPKLINSTMLYVDYNCGIAQACRLSMDIIRPHKLGKMFFLGMDISKDSHLFIQFIYEKQGKLYRMKTVDFGTQAVDLDSLGPALVEPINFPFPTKDRIENEFGIYKVPFLKSNREEAFFEFPEDYTKCN